MWEQRNLIKFCRTWLIESVQLNGMGKIVYGILDTVPTVLLFFVVFNVSEAEKNLYLFIQIANANFQSLFNRYRLQNDQRFSLKGITNGFEVTEQGFYYQYYDNYSQLVHTQIDIDDWQLKTWSEKTAARIVTKEFWVEMITIFLVLILLIILLSVIISKQVTETY